MSPGPRLIRILTAADHALLREGIVEIVNADQDMNLVCALYTA
jgi:hypothetical protein